MDGEQGRVEPLAERPIRVALADDHPCQVVGVRAVLADAAGAPGFELVGATGAGREVLPLVERTRPDVLLLDPCLPDLDGLAVARLLRQRCPAVAVLAYTGPLHAHAARALLEAGVRGYVRTTAGTQELPAAIRAVAAGGTAFSPAVLQAALGRAAATLTAQEAAVLHGLTEGLRDRQMAAGLHISEKGVRYHLDHLYEKLGVTTRLQAVLAAQRLDLLPPSSGSDTLGGAD